MYKFNKGRLSISLKYEKSLELIPDDEIQNLRLRKRFKLK